MTESSVAIHILKILQDNGYSIAWAEDAEENRVTGPTAKEAVKHCEETEEGYIRIIKGEKGASLWLVFGNEPDEIICDYSYSADWVADDIDDAIKHATIKF